MLAEHPWKYANVWNKAVAYWQRNALGRRNMRAVRLRETPKPRPWVRILPPLPALLLPCSSQRTA